MSDTSSTPETRALASPMPEPTAAPLRPWLREIGGLARRAAFHLLHPTERTPCLEGDAPGPLRRLYYATSDGWRMPLRVVPACSGGAGEPVVLAHALGLDADVWRIGTGATLARALSRAGFTVYLLAHRGDRDAIAPEGPARFDFDDLLRRDVPAALSAVRRDCGFARVHWVGHGMGGQLGLAHAARDGGLASVSAICAPARFPPAPRSEARRLALAASLLPDRWQLPLRHVAWASVPWIDEQASLLGQVRPGVSDGARIRSLLTWGAGDLPVGLLRQLGRWQRSGTWSDRTGLIDYAETLVDARGPALIVAAPADELCPVDSALWAQKRFGGHAEALVLPETYGHLDTLVAPSAEQEVFRPMIRWLTAQRRRAWVAA